MQDGAGFDLVCNALAKAAADGAAVVVFGRDHALRVFAEHHEWRMLALVDGTLGPLAQAEPAAVDQIMEAPEQYPNVVPFPLSARTAGVA
jgi:hypothetical protein